MVQCSIMGSFVTERNRFVCPQSPRGRVKTLGF